MRLLESLLVAVILTGTAEDSATPPAVTIQLGRPRTQVESFLRLFQPPFASSPAVALANWKRATKGTKSLGKGPEAALAALNPAMARELDVLAGAELVFDFSADDGKPSWTFVVPKDDGTFASFATSMALTDGGGDGALGRASVDRLSMAQGPLMAREGDLVVLANNREMLARGLALAQKDKAGVANDSVPQIRVTAAGLSKSSNLQVRRFAELLRAFGASEFLGDAKLIADEFVARGSCACSWTDSNARIDPKWLAEVPAKASLVFSIALDPSPQTLDRLFAVANKMEKVDPELANRPPVRARIGLFCRVAGLDIEKDVWPKLEGVTGFLDGDIHQPKCAGIAFHMVDEASTTDVRDRVLPKLARSLALDPAKENATETAKPLGTFRGQTLWVSKAGDRSVSLTWGIEGPLAEFAGNPPRRFLDTVPQSELKTLQTAQRAGWFWPARLGLLEKGAALTLAVDQTDCIRWVGRRRDQKIEDTICWRGLDRAVRRFLELTPQEPAPAGRK